MRTERLRTAALPHDGATAPRAPRRPGAPTEPNTPEAGPSPAPLTARAVAALAEPAWQVRAGAATALSVADPDVAVPALAKALADSDADVRKAAVLALIRHGASPEARAALATATTDPHADVRAYAARAL
ncbi:HEAT repeat domain-containing protein [Streptomyces sp. NPDC086081]|uniref:HEAT repeat domain-containing protein n=1 Tax=Streptomyces sp. NPDC086081 TaxID=3365749 RepID=UPI003806E249